MTFIISARQTGIAAGLAGWPRRARSGASQERAITVTLEALQERSRVGETLDSQQLSPQCSAAVSARAGPAGTWTPGPAACRGRPGTAQAPFSSRARRARWGGTRALDRTPGLAAPGVVRLPHSPATGQLVITPGRGRSVRHAAPVGRGRRGLPVDQARSRSLSSKGDRLGSPLARLPGVRPARRPRPTGHLAGTARVAVRPNRHDCSSTARDKRTGLARRSSRVGRNATQGATSCWSSRPSAHSSQRTAAAQPIGAGPRPGAAAAAAGSATAASRFAFRRRTEALRPGRELSAAGPWPANCGR